MATEIYTVLKFKWTTERDEDYKNDIKEYGSYRNVDDAYLKLMKLVSKDYAEEHGVNVEMTDDLPDYVFTRVAADDEWVEHNRRKREAIEGEIRRLKRDFDREMYFLGGDEFFVEMEKDLIAKNGGVYDDAVSEELAAAIDARYQAGLNRLLQPYLTEKALVEQDLDNYPYEWLSQRRWNHCRTQKVSSSGRSMASGTHLEAHLSTDVTTKTSSLKSTLKPVFLLVSTPSTALATSSSKLCSVEYLVAIVQLSQHRHRHRHQCQHLQLLSSCKDSNFCLPSEYWCFKQQIIMLVYSVSSRCYPTDYILATFQPVNR